ncbi:hypothetical protein BGZ70_006403, partial [Mortierella alpina]
MRLQSLPGRTAKASNLAVYEEAQRLLDELEPQIARCEKAFKLFDNLLKHQTSLEVPVAPKSADNSRTRNNVSDGKDNVPPPVKNGYSWNNVSDGKDNAPPPVKNGYSWNNASEGKDNAPPLSDNSQLRNNGSYSRDNAALYHQLKINDDMPRFYDDTNPREFLDQLRHMVMPIVGKDLFNANCDRYISYLTVNNFHHQSLEYEFDKKRQDGK